MSRFLDGSLKVDRLITARRRLAEVNEAIADMEAGMGIRTVFTLLILVGAPRSITVVGCRA